MLQCTAERELPINMCIFIIRAAIPDYYALSTNSFKEITEAESLELDLMIEGLGARTACHKNEFIHFKEACYHYLCFLKRQARANSMLLSQSNYTKQVHESLSYHNELLLSILKDQALSNLGLEVKDLIEATHEKNTYLVVVSTVFKSKSLKQLSLKAGSVY